MPGQEQVRPQRREDDPDDTPAPAAAPGGARTNVDDQEYADVLADIDDVLESNAEDFVRSFVQKGGQ